LLPMILVRNQIGDMLGGEQANLHVEKIGKELGLQVKEFRFLYNIYWYIVRDFKVTGIKFMTVFVMRKDAACP